MNLCIKMHKEVVLCYRA